MDGYSKATTLNVAAGIALLIMICLSYFGTSFSATGESNGQSCDISVNMMEFTHCHKGTYAIRDFCEWDRKGTLRSRFCAQHLAVVSMSYAVVFVLVVATLLGCLHALGGNICQLVISIALCILHSISAIVCVIMAIAWAFSKGALPDIAFDPVHGYDVPGEPGSEWTYQSSQSGIVTWTLSWGVFASFAGAVVAVGCAVCSYVAVKQMMEAVVIRVEVKQVESEEPTNNRFLDNLPTTGVITHTEAIAGITNAGSPPNSPTQLATRSHNVEVALETGEEETRDATGCGDADTLQSVL